jgi:hypothetical protein
LGGTKSGDNLMGEIQGISSLESGGPKYEPINEKFSRVAVNG